MLLAHHLFERIEAGGTGDVEIWADTLDAARRETYGEHQLLWEASTEIERRVVKLIAHRTVPLTGREAMERFGLAKSGSSRVAVERLAGDGHLVRDESTRTGWRIVDPFFAAWLRGE
jgi:hypothetical protein